MNRNCMNQTMPAGNSRMMYGRQNMGNARMQDNRMCDNKVQDNRIRNEQICGNKAQNNRMNDERMCDNKVQDNRIRDERMCDNKVQNNRMHDERMCTDSCMQEHRMGGHEAQRHTWEADVPTCSCQQLMTYINEVSFAVYETLLYLDTHPDDQEAMQFFREHNHKRNHALKVYAKMFGPLVIANADDCESQCWEWMNQPWPWEGGDC